MLTEHDEQRLLFQWARFARGTHPELELMYAIPNAGKRTPRQGAYMKAEGLKPGMLDVCLPVPRNGYGALYIELKRIKGEKPTEDQEIWLQALSEAGNRTACCKGWEAARKVIEGYLAPDTAAPQEKSLFEPHGEAGIAIPTGV